VNGAGCSCSRSWLPEETRGESALAGCCGDGSRESGQRGSPSGLSRSFRTKPRGQTRGRVEESKRVRVAERVGGKSERQWNAKGRQRPF
jgi:hypothetical protein